MIACMLFGAAQAEGDFTSGDFTCAILPDGTASIVSYSGGAGALEIPAVLEGRAVTQIGPHAFEQAAMRQVSIPEGVSDIGEYAFYGCHSLMSVQIPGSVERIGAYAFGECALYSVNLPEGLLSLGDRAFYSASLPALILPGSLAEMGENPFAGAKLTSLSVSGDNTAFVIREDCLYDTAGGRLIQCLTKEREGVFRVPEGIREIDAYAFYQCKGIEEILLPETLTAVREGAFWVCSSLRTIDLPDSVAFIGSRAFYRCDALASIHIPYALASTEGNPFVSCENLTSLDIAPDHPVFSVEDGVLFNRAEGILTAYPLVSGPIRYEIPVFVTAIGPDAFNSCYKLREVTFPAGLTSIGDGAFFGCTVLEDAALPESLTYLGREAFRWCCGITSVTIPGSVGRLSDDAFGSCRELEKVIILPGADEIGDNVFSGCDHLSAVDLPEGLVSIGRAAFSGTALRRIELPESLRRLGDMAFWGCKELREVVIPSPETEPGEDVFLFMQDFTVVTPEGGAAWTYCRENRISVTGK